MIGTTNCQVKAIKIISDSHTLFYVNGNSLADQSRYNTTSAMSHNGNVKTDNVPGPFNNQPCPVIYLNSGRIGWTNNSTVFKVLTMTDGWTWEFWRYKISTLDSEDCFSIGNYSDTSANALHCDSTNGYYSYLYRNSAWYSDSTAAPYNEKLWYHVCYVMNNSVLTIYLNGVAKTTWSNYGNLNLAAGVIFGGYNATTLVGDGFLNSYIAEARISDIPRYTTNFTPPTRFLY